MFSSGGPTCVWKAHISIQYTTCTVHYSNFMALFSIETHAWTSRIGSSQVIGQVAFSSSPLTTSTTRLIASITSSTVPPMPCPAKDIEFPTYVGLPLLRAMILANLVVKSTVELSVYRGVLRGCAEGLTRLSFFCRSDEKPNQLI